MTRETAEKIFCLFIGLLIIVGSTLYCAWAMHLNFEQTMYRLVIPGAITASLGTIPIWLIIRNIKK
jgi:hypothetical protein